MTSVTVICTVVLVTMATGTDTYIVRTGYYGYTPTCTYYVHTFIYLYMYIHRDTHSAEITNYCIYNVCTCTCIYNLYTYMYMYVFVQEGCQYDVYMYLHVHVRIITTVMQLLIYLVLTGDSVVLGADGEDNERVFLSVQTVQQNNLT